MSVNLLHSTPATLPPDTMEFQHYTEGPLWRVDQIEGKGRGAIAKTDISKGLNLTVKKINKNYNKTELNRDTHFT